jgi:hypothetical protein
MASIDTVQDTDAAGEPPTDVVAAMFEDQPAAVAARDALVGSGIASDAVEIVTAAPATPGAAHGSRHVWQRIRDRFMPHPHAHGFAEGVERGHAMVFVRAPSHRQAAAMATLERHDPIDVMERSSQWTNSGWSGVHRSQQLLFDDHPYPDHIPATGLINDDSSERGIGSPLVNPMGIEVQGVRQSGSDRVRRYERA